jgi:glycosyltransferase involved in cell wall biosynthesis
MKILQLIQQPQRRGAEVFAVDLSRALRRRGHTVRIRSLYQRAGSSMLDEDVRDLGGGHEHWTELSVGVNPAVLARLRREIAWFDPDVVQANGARTVKYAALAKTLFPGQAWSLVYRNIGTVSDWLLGLRRRAFYGLAVFPMLDGIVGVSARTLAAAVATHGTNIPAVHIPRGIDPAQLVPKRARAVLRDELGVGRETRVLLYVGALSKEKRPDRFLRVVKELRGGGADVHAWLVGDGPNRDDLEASAVRDLGVGCVRFLGERRDVADYMNAADALVLTSDTEGLPGVVLEAAWLHLPVVATNVGGVREVIADGETGFVREREDVVGLADACRTVLGDPSVASELAENARRLVEARFTIDAVTRAYETFYERMMPVRSPARARLVRRLRSAARLVRGGAA